MIVLKKATTLDNLIDRNVTDAISETGTKLQSVKFKYVPFYGILFNRSGI